jgi:hypothetical protein
VRTRSGATAVPVVWFSRRGSRQIERLGWAHEAELVALRAAVVERVAAGRALLDLGVGAVAGVGRLEIVGSRGGQPWDALCCAYDMLV